MAKRKKFYFVDDDPDMIDFVTAHLEAAGHKVTSSTDSAKALSEILSSKPDCVLLDMMMPGMDGHTLVRLILEELPNIKVILMSGYAEDAIPGEISEDQSINFLPKPFSLQELAVKVKDVLAE